MDSVPSDRSFYAFHYIPAHPGHPLHSTELPGLPEHFSVSAGGVHSSVAGTGVSADLRSRSPFPPDVTFGPAPSLRVRILLKLHQPISS